MAEPFELDVLLGAHSAAIFELYARHRAMFRMLEQHGIVLRETFEAELESYLQDHRGDLIHEGEEWLQKFVVAYLQQHPPQA